MATHRIPILGASAMPDTSGSVFFEPSTVKDTNDLYPHLVAIFKDTATKIKLGGSFVVPKNYVGTAKIIIVWRANATTGAAVWDFDYRAIANAESLDPSTDQEAVTGTTTTSATAMNRQETALTLTAGNLAVDDLALFNLSRDGADAGDTLAADAIVEAVLFEYADV